MFWRYRRIPQWLLILFALMGLIIVFLIEYTQKEVRRAWFDEKVLAALKMEKAIEVISNHRQGIRIDPISDPNRTGLVGDEFSLLTTDSGNLEEKLTVLNPNFAALVYDMLKRAKVKEGDKVAIGWTGSFPGANIATLAAIEQLGAEPVIITSLGSSTWGANNPDLTWLDIEEILKENGVFSHTSIAASIGGRGDRGGNISPKGRDIARSVIYSKGIDIIDEQTLSRSISRRMELYARALDFDEEYSAYVNVGGGLGSIGSAQNLVLVPQGLHSSIPVQNYPRKGTMILFGEEGVPVINLINMEELAESNGLPIAPEPLPDPPSGGVFYRRQYNIGAVAGLLILYVALMAFFISRKIK